MKSFFKMSFENGRYTLSSDFYATLDLQGRVVMRSDGPFDPKPFGIEEKGFNNVDFITINKEDAQNLYDMLCEAIDRLKSGTREDDDNEVFGEKAISFEKLADYLGLVTYDINEVKENK